MVKVDYCDIPLAEDPFIDYNPTTTKVKAKFKVGDVVNEIEGGWYYCDLESRVAMTSCSSFASGDTKTIHSATFSETHQNWWYQFHAHSNYQSECSIALHKEEPVSEPIKAKDRSLEGGSSFDGELLLDLLSTPKEKKRSITSIPVLELIDISTIK